MGKLIFHIDGDAFFASVEQSFHPALRGRPVVVGGLAEQRGVVHTASYEARQRGLYTGMPLVRAKQVCPEAIFVKGNFQHYQAVSRYLQDIYLRYTPQVEFTSLDDAYLDMSGSRRLFPDTVAAARELWLAVWREVGISISIGIGPNKLIARLASEVRKPGGIFDVPAAASDAFLLPLPVNALPGIGRKYQRQLSDLGITTIAQLRCLPRLTLEDIFGRNGGKFHALAHGRDTRPVERRIRPKSISRETSFEEDVSNPGVILSTLQYLTERIAAKLRQKDLAARQVEVKLRYADFKQSLLNQTLPAASNDAAVLFGFVRDLALRPPERRVRLRLVGVKVSQLDWQDCQAELFATPLPREDINTTIDAIRARHGFTSILPATTLQLHNYYRMERSGYVLHAPALTE
jgi:DNA polymerase-4